MADEAKPSIFRKRHLPRPRRGALVTPPASVPPRARRSGPHAAAHSDGENRTYGTRPSADAVEMSSPYSSISSLRLLRHLDGMKIGMIMAAPSSKSTPLDAIVLKPAA